MAAFREQFLEALTSLFLKLKAKGREKSHGFNFFLVEGLIVALSTVKYKRYINIILYYIYYILLSFHSVYIVRWLNAKFRGELYRADKSTKLCMVEAYGMLVNLKIGAHSYLFRILQQLLSEVL